MTKLTSYLNCHTLRARQHKRFFFPYVLYTLGRALDKKKSIKKMVVMVVGKDEGEKRWKRDCSGGSGWVGIRAVGGKANGNNAIFQLCLASNVTSQ